MRVITSLFLLTTSEVHGLFSFSCFARVQSRVLAPPAMLIRQRGGLHAGGRWLRVMSVLLESHVQAAALNQVRQTL